MKITDFKKWLIERGLGYEHLAAFNTSREKLIISKNGNLVSVIYCADCYNYVQKTLIEAGY